MPTKPNKAGQQQNYVPQGNGDASGEYADNASGSNIHFTNFKKPDEVKTEKVDTDQEIQIEKTDKPSHTDFNGYLLSKHGDGTNLNDFGKALKDNFDVGNDDAKSLVNSAIKNGVTIHHAKGISNYSGAVNLSNISHFGAYSKDKGDTFYHEFWHCFDNIYAKGQVDAFGKPTLSGLITEEDIKHLSETAKSKKTKLYGFSIESFAHLTYMRDNLSTCKVLSNGKTMFETWKNECHKMTLGNKKEGAMSWHQLIKDYEKDIDDEIDKQFPNFKENQKKYANFKQEIEQQAQKLFPTWTSANTFDNSAWDKRKDYVKKKLIEGGYGELEEEKEKVDIAKGKIKNQKNKEWLNMSDAYGIYNKVSYGFCGGHAGNYGGKLEGAGALEFMAEYGAAKAIGNEKQLSLFQKYFPETSKMCEELQNMILEHHKKGGISK